jgi:hypothetical protein
MAADDVFISYRHTDAEAVAALVAALRQEGLEVSLDEQRIDELAGIQAAIEEGLGTAKVLVAWYSAAYPESRSCQWELTTALVVALAQSQAMERIQEKVLAVRRRILGEEHPETTVSDWNLFLVLMGSEEKDSADKVFKNHLAWVLQAEPARLAGDQGWIRQMLTDMLKQKS